MRRLALLIALVFLGPAAAADPFDGFDAAVAEAMKKHGVPGLGVAVVKDGKVILSKGYGVRTAGKPEKVTDQSLFAIGSVSKSVTATALGMLVDDGKLKWNDPVIKHLKSFRLSDSYLTQETTVRDVLSHRVGLGRNDLVWYGSPFTRDEVLAKLPLMKTDGKFRAGLVYNNILYMAAGQIIPEVADKKPTWDEFVADRVFKPLRMASANTSVAKLPKDGDVATPHEKVKGVPTAVPWRNGDVIGPAGSINAGAADMAEYVKFHLAKGKVGSERVLKSGTVKALHSPNTLMPRAGLFNPDSHYAAYGLGWMLADYRGRKLSEHGGNIDGMTAQVGMLHDEKIGVVVLANLGASVLPQALMYDIFDRVLGEPTQDLAGTTALIGFLSEMGVQVALEPAETSRIKDTKPSLPLPKYAGKYRDDLHAPLTVKHTDGKLTLSYVGNPFVLDHWHYDTFRATSTAGRPMKMLFTFGLDSDGTVGEVRLTESATAEIRLKRAKE